MEKSKIIRRVLLIDDDEVTNMINTHIITNHFHFVVEAFTSAEKALEYCKETSSDEFPDAIFLDINMPYMDGWEFLCELEKLPPASIAKCKVYLLTSSIDAEDIEKSKTYKLVDEFISKPLTQSKLKILVPDTGPIVL